MATAPARRAGGIFWSTVNGGASVVVPFLVFAAFSRLMSPAQLAVVAISTAMLEMLKAAGPQGFYDVLVSQDEGDVDHHRAGLFLFLFFAVLFAAIYCALILASSHLVGQDLPPILMILGLKLIFDYAAMQPQAVLVKRGSLRRLGSRGLTSGIVAGLGALVLAFLTGPVVGLASYYVLQAFTNFLLIVVGTHALVRPSLNFGIMRQMARQGWSASGVRGVAAVQNYFDQILLSPMFTAHVLGAYNLGKRLEVISMTLGSSFSQLVLQPGFARGPTVEERTDTMARGVAAISLVCGVPVAVLLVWHQLTIPFVFGDQWAFAAPVAAVLALGGLVRAVGATGGMLMTAMRRNGQLFTLTALGAAGYVVAILVFARFGVMVAAWIVVVRAIIMGAMQFVFCGLPYRAIGRFLLRDCFGPLAGVALVALLSGKIVAALVGTAGIIPVFAVLAAAGSTGALAGFLLLRRRI